MVANVVELLFGEIVPVGRAIDGFEAELTMSFGRIIPIEERHASDSIEFDEVAFEMFGHYHGADASSAHVVDLLCQLLGIRDKDHIGCYFGIPLPFL